MMMQTSYALSKIFKNVTLISPRIIRKENTAESNIFNYYNLKKSFDIKILNTILKDNSSKINQYIQKFFLNLILSFRLFVKSFLKRNKIIFIFRCYISSLSYLLIHYPFRRFTKSKMYFEVHGFDNSKFHNYILGKMDGLICITENLAKDINEKLKIPSNKIIVARLGFNPDNFNISVERNNILERYNLRKSGKYAVYTGKVTKTLPEIHYYYSAAKKIPDMNFLIVGGKPEVVDFWKNMAANEKISNIYFTGFVEPNYVNTLQLFSDILLMYYDSSIKTAKYASPGKLMEYMSTGKPIVASDIPSVKEVLNENIAFLVPQDNIEKFVEILKNIAIDYDKAAMKGIKCKETVQKFSWENRAKIISGFVNDENY